MQRRAPAGNRRRAPRRDSSWISRGITFDAVEITPFPPSAMIGSVSASSPERIARRSPQSRRMSDTWSIEPEDSLTPTIFLISHSRAKVSGAIFEAVRPGML